MNATVLWTVLNKDGDGDDDGAAVGGGWASSQGATQGKNLMVTKVVWTCFCFKFLFCWGNSWAYKKDTPITIASCLLHSCLYPASCSVIMFIERATLHGAWEIFNIYEYNINQADNWLLIGLICARSADLMCRHWFAVHWNIIIQLVRSSQSLASASQAPG